MLHRIRGPLILLSLLASCARGVSGPVDGEESAEAAVRAFLFAARASDFRGLVAVWGNAEGTVRERAARGPDANPKEVEQRAMIIACHLKHDDATIGVPQPGAEGRRVFPLELAQGEIRLRTTITTVQQVRTGRWFVEDVDLAPVRLLCRP